MRCYFAQKSNAEFGKTHKNEFYPSAFLTKMAEMT
jgi:hypothetical protein